MPSMSILFPSSMEDMKGAVAWHFTQNGGGHITVIGMIQDALAAGLSISRHGCVAAC